MKPPCVIVVSHILPAIRILVARVLIDEYELRQKDVASKMDLTPAAITQYLKRLRGDQDTVDFIRSKESFMAKIRSIAKHLAEGDIKSSSNELITMVCESCCLLRGDGEFMDSNVAVFGNLSKFSCAFCEKRNPR
ncbi:MAG: transcriptional regulator [Candidatus Hodarchaeota archaeon]